MSGWDDLVTTALLGTERRWLPDSLPAAVSRLAAARTDPGLSVLDAAAGYVGYLAAGARPASCPVPGPAARQVVDLAPDPAQTLLRRLLDAGHVDLVDEWLAECARRGLGVRAGFWTPLATAAAAPSGPDRSLVRTALGQRGLAFLRLNPAWRSVLRPSRSDRARSGHVTPDLVAIVPSEELASIPRSWVAEGHDPARVAQWLTVLPGPWSAAVADAGLRLLASGRLQSPAGRRLGLALAHRAPLSSHGQVHGLASEWTARHAARPEPPPAGLMEAADVLDLRVQIRQAFGATARPEETL